LKGFTEILLFIYSSDIIQGAPIPLGMIPRRWGTLRTFARMRFNALPVSQREWLAERVAEVVLALHEGNIIAWGVGREAWQRYAARVQR
jgi:hypothetical protein